jgi:cell division septal protein FtsQ
MRKKRNRYRPDQVRRRKVVKYWFKATFGFAFSLVAIILFSAALAHGYYALVNAPWFRVSTDDVSIVGLKHLKEGEILNTLMIPPQASLLNLKSVDLAKRLEALPWLESSVVQFSLPNRIVVEVTEREPLVLIHGEDFYLVDTDGKLVSRASSEQKKDFLLVDGFSGQRLKEGDLLPRATLRELKMLLATLAQAQSWLPLNAILVCRWSAETGYALYTARNNICIQLGWDRFEQKFAHLHRLFAFLEERQLWNAVIGIDLDYEDRAYLEGLFPFPKGT